MKKPLRGVLTALVTPFQSSGEIDWKAWEALLADQVKAGVAGVVPCGTTGESPTLSLKEKKALIESAISACENTQVAVLAGTGSNSTPETVEFSKWADSAGVDGVLVVTPYYNKPSQSGLRIHFERVADALSCPLVLYNVPGRTGVGMSADTVAQLAKHPKIRSIKEASGNVAFCSEIFDACIASTTTIEVLSGDDATYLPLLSAGAHGVISVASNLFPRELVQLQSLWDKGSVREALAIHQKYYPLFRDLFVESNPVPVKHAMNWVGMGPSQVRLPLCALSEQNQSKLISSLKKCGFHPQGGTK